MYHRRSDSNYYKNIFISQHVTFSIKKTKNSSVRWQSMLLKIKQFTSDAAPDKKTGATNLIIENLIELIIKINCVI